MRLLKILVFGAAFLAAGTATAENMPMPQVSYAADAVMETNGTKMNGKIYAAPGMERREQRAGGQKNIIIIRHDKGVVWNLMPSEGMYMENQLGRNSGPGADFSIREKSVLGEEKIGGLMTTKYKVIIEQNNSVFGGFMWITKDGITMKMDAIAKDQDSKMRIRQELSNVRIGRQDPALFQVPAGYQKMEMPDMGAMMKSVNEGGEGDVVSPATDEEADGLGDMMKGMKGLFGR